MNDTTANLQFTVLVNAEHQYSIWPKDKAAPVGWRHVGGAGERQACIDYVENVWHDLTPLSLRDGA